MIITLIFVAVTVIGLAFLFFGFFEATIVDERIECSFNEADESDYEWGRGTIYYKHTGKKKLKVDFDADRESFQIGGGIASAFGIISLAICGLIIVCNKAKLSVSTDITRYETRLDEIKLKRDTLLHYSDGEYGIEYTTSETNKTIIIRSDNPALTKSLIDEYNEDVIEFKKMIYTIKLYRESPWISWFSNDAITKIDGYNPQAVSYKYVINDLETYTLFK